MSRIVQVKLVFEETKVRGEDDTLTCSISSNDANIDIIGKNWTEIKEKYPTLRDVLIRLFNKKDWSQEWAGRPTIQVYEVKGHKGLYDFENCDEVKLNWNDF